MKKVIAILIAAILLTAFSACGQKNTVTGAKTDSVSQSAAAVKSLWDEAVYLEDTELGEGSAAFVLEVTAEGKTVAFTVHTDKKTVGEALLDNGIIAGEEGAYGLYVKKVNGITADYDINKAYWSFNINGSAASTGVDGAEIKQGERYQLEYTK